MQFEHLHFFLSTYKNIHKGKDLFIIKENQVNFKTLYMLIYFKVYYFLFFFFKADLIFCKVVRHCLSVWLHETKATKVEKKN